VSEEVNPELRKQKSETELARHAIPINPTLPLIESDGQVALRTADELFQRLVALWAVAGTAFLRNNDFFRRYMIANDHVSWLSTEERDFLLAEQPTEQQIIQASWQLEGLYFLAWCGGLVDELTIPSKESSVEPFMHLFPREGEDLTRLRDALSVRSVSEVLDWSDLLYRLHWAVRDARLRGSQSPSGVKAGVVQEWHRAVNWMTRYEEEDDWDAVATDT
jgi:hypothetical protein